MSEGRDPLQGHVPVPMGEQAEQSQLQRHVEGLFFSFLTIAANEVPIAGSALQELRQHRAMKALERRLSIFVEDWKSQMGQLKESAVDKQFLNSEEFFDLVRDTYEAVIRTRDEEKIRLYARILTESTVRDKRGAYFPEEYLHLIADLTPLELRVARNFYDSDVREMGGPSPREEKWKAWKEQVCNSLNLDQATLSMSMSRIAATGLIEPVISGEDEETVWMHSGERGDPSFYGVTPAFEKLMEFLELDE